MKRKRHDEMKHPPDLRPSWRIELAKKLVAHGHDAGLHSSGVVIFYNGIVSARASDVSWLTQRERKDRLK